LVPGDPTSNNPFIYSDLENAGASPKALLDRRRQQPIPSSLTPGGSPVGQTVKSPRGPRMPLSLIPGVSQMNKPNIQSDFGRDMEIPTSQQQRKTPRASGYPDPARQGYFIPGSLVPGLSPPPAKLTKSALEKEL